jgi:hypothetical protein
LFCIFIDCKLCAPQEELIELFEFVFFKGKNFSLKVSFEQPVEQARLANAFAITADTQITERQTPGVTVQR